MSVFTVPTVTWPDPAQVFVTGRGASRRYQTPLGLLPSSTTILKCSGLGTEGLIKWSANIEREACLEAAAQVAADGKAESPAEVVAAIQALLGSTRAHARAVEKAADIGTMTHQTIEAWLRCQLMGIEYVTDTLPDPVTWAFMSFQDWWKTSGFVPVAMEQPIYHAAYKYAGTLDLIAWRDGRFWLIDFKTSKYVYDEHHMQCASYMAMADAWLKEQGHVMEDALIVRIPKVEGETSCQIVQVGEMYGNTRRTQSELLSAFLGFKAAWDVLCAEAR